MTTPSQLSAQAAHEQGHITGPIIDTDIHETFTSLQDLVPYLQQPWRGLIERGAWVGIPPVLAYWGSHGVMRADALLASGATAGSSYEVLKAQVFDPYPITHGILTGQLSPGVIPGQFEFAAALASAYNDFLVDQWLPRDPRLFSSLHVTPQDPQAAVREIERLGDHPQIVQVLLPIGTRAYGDPFYHPIFEAAERHHLVIAMHHQGAVHGALGQERYYIEWHVNVPQGAMSMVTSLVVNGVFEKFPSLHFVILESGYSWLPHVMWRLDQNYRSLHQEIPWVKSLPSRHIRERIKFSTQPVEDISPENWLRLIDMLDSDRMLMFATDYPHWDFDSPQQAIPAALPAELRRRIFYENARELYGFDASLSL